jgi:hypothetical protein
MNLAKTNMSMQYQLFTNFKTEKTIKDFILTNNIDLLYDKEDIPTYLHYNGSITNPDFTLQSLDTAILATRKITDDP